jgi:undecaprenyl-diphosphatase
LTLLAAALLGVVQGITEFLPISSSAHLILARAFFGWDGDQFGLPFDVACHVGTLAALLIYFRGDLASMAGAIPDMFRPSESAAARLGWLLVAGTLPVAVVGLFYNDWIADRLRTPGVAAIALALGAALLLFVERIGPRHRDLATLGLLGALLIGIAQSLALIPGVSRSGATIAIAMLVGLRRESAARFGFLLGIPAILAAAAREAIPVFHQVQSPAVAQLFLVAAVVSAVVGYLVIKYFIRYLRTYSLDVFAYYRLALAAATAVWLVMGNR